VSTAAQLGIAMMMKWMTPKTRAKIMGKIKQRIILLQTRTRVGKGSGRVAKGDVL
jgi:hypothetical protein